MLKLAYHFSAFNQRLKYAHFRPHVSVKSDPRSWWKYAYRAVSDQVKKGRLNQKIVLSILCLGKELYIDTASHVFVVFASTTNQGIHLFPRKLTTRRKRNLRRWKIRCLDGLHDFDTCIAKNEEAIQIDPHFVECYGNMANAWKEKGNIDVAIRYYLIAIEVCYSHQSSP
ncbi:uncharacterized protein LOC133833915 [Humulus lupulus]|uniref:uncharacterized protein LOC133833915 n=1 Tax=Humulus lupulus TaxID=3486 RepID=UPI002B4130D1|nr:uncharacterized protein LOC133833915 [Humulus lupulus]